MQGKLGARIDILFIDSPDVFKARQICVSDIMSETNRHFKNMTECLKDQTKDLYFNDGEMYTGRVSFMLLQGHDKLYQEIEIPVLEARIGREFFAKWAPNFAFLDTQYLTDANGYDLIARDVFKSGSAPFSSSFYPVDNSITITDFGQLNSMTIWNDRP